MNDEYNAFKEVQLLLKDGFQLNDLQEAAKILVKYAADFIPEASGKEKMSWVKVKIKEFVENYDTLLPVVGSFLDIPIVDTLEEFLLDKLLDIALKPVIEWVYAREEIKELLR